MVVIFFGHLAGRRASGSGWDSDSLHGPWKETDERELESHTPNHTSTPRCGERHPQGSQACVLLSSVFGPYARDDECGSRSIKPMEPYHNPGTRAQGSLSRRAVARRWDQPTQKKSLRLDHSLGLIPFCGLTASPKSPANPAGYAGAPVRTARERESRPGPCRTSFLRAAAGGLRKS